MRTKAQLITAIVLLSVACVFAADWPQYFGPKRDSTSTEKGILRSWPKEGPKVLWTAAVGVGFGGPAVSGGKVYLLDRDEKVGDNLRCLDFSSGKELWHFAYDAPGSFMFPGSRSTPTVDGEHVYTCGPLGDLYCINTSTHKPVWHKNIWTDFGGGSAVPAGGGGIPPGFGPGGRAGSPGGRPGGPPSGPPGAAGGRGDMPAGRGGAPPGGQAGAPAGGGAPRGGGAPGGELPRWAITQNPLIYVESGLFTDLSTAV